MTIRLGLAAPALAMLVAGWPAAGQADRNQEQLRFSDRSPLSPLPEQERRLKWGRRVLLAETSRYELIQETFHVYYPRKFDPKRTYGLLVWMTPGDVGTIPPSWERELDRADLIGVGADRAGRTRPMPVRIGLALDAVANLTARHRVDPARVYVIGFSAGGDAACQLTFHYPDVFQGGIYLAGCLYHRDVPIPDRPGFRWQGAITPPDDERLALVKERSRHVYLVGADDRENLGQNQAVHRLASEEDGFRHARLTVVPGLGHELPPTQHLRRAIAFLDDPPRPKAPASTPAPEDPPAPEPAEDEPPGD